MDLTAIRNFKDFLLLYNEISETCFRRCAGSTINRELSKEEETCVDNCAGKYVNANHRIMGVYVEVQSALVNKRMEEYTKAAEAAAASATATAAVTADTVTESVETTESSATVLASQEQTVAK